jgi:hypothetical protein
LLYRTQRPESLLRLQAVTAYFISRQAPKIRGELQAHLCKNCLETSITQSDPDERRHCPLCKPLGAPPFPLNPTKESSLSHKSTRLNRIESCHDDDYFQPQGCSSKMDALISDVKKDVETTKRYELSVSLKPAFKMLMTMQYCFLLLDADPGSHRQALGPCQHRLRSY